MRVAFRKSIFFLAFWLLASLQAQPLYEIHWTSSTDPTFGGSAGATLTQPIDTACSLVTLSVTDPVNTPLPAFNAITLNPQIAGGGGDLTDLSGNMSFHARVRSKDSVTLGFLLRAGDGSSAFRTDRLEVVIPGDTTAWTEVSFVFDSSNIAGFDSTDLRDIWFYLDRGTENFAGDEFVFDYFAIGEAPADSTWSDCPGPVSPPPIAGPLYENHWTSGSDPLFGGSGGAALTQLIDSACSYVALSVTDPVNAALPAFSPLSLNPQMSGGGDLVDLSGNMRFHMRVKSRDTVTLGFLLRAGDGSAGLRTDLLEAVIPGDTTAWTAVTFIFDASSIAGFDSTDLRDIWFYLDRGTENFAGDDFVVDYFAIGEAPADSTWSTCPDPVSPPPVAGPLYENHWTSGSDPLFGASGGAALTQLIDSACSYVALSVTDPVNAALPAFSPLSLNPQMSGGGGDLVDLSGNMSFHIRARSREAVTLGFLLRGGDGTTAFRTDRLETLIPGDTTSWTEVSFVFDSTNLGGFDSTDLRDIWFYLDRGVENFAGDDFVVDYFAIGAVPADSSWSNCPVDSGPPPSPTVSYLLHWDSASDSTFGGSGGDALTQTLDSSCSTLSLSVTDPVLNPMGSFSPLRVDPENPNGTDITDLSGSMQFHVRVRSRDSISLGLLLRSGDGSAAFRTDRIAQDVPGDTTTWTELTYVFDANTIGGFDSTDLNDIWFYLDAGTENFAGDEVVFDYVAVGPKPAASTHSDCSLLPPFDFPWVLHWADTADDVTSGSGAPLLNQLVDTACSELKISVALPIIDPHPAFRPIILNPQDELGNDIGDLSGQLKMYARVRSLEEVEFSALLRGGEGGTNERTEIISFIIPAGLDEWTSLEFDFSGPNLAGFDSTDLRDIFLYLDRSLPDFNGNEFYLDYISLGSAPDAMENSTCVETVSINALDEAQLRIYPNPIQSGQDIQIHLDTPSSGQLEISLVSLRGQQVYQGQEPIRPNQHTYSVSLPVLPSGMYIIQLTDGVRSSVHKLKIW